MTMKVQEQTISIDRKQHPNAVRYPCRATHEILEAGRKFISSLSQEERDLLLQNDLILDEEETTELFDAFQENDIIGLGILRPNGFHTNTYRIEKIHSGEDWMECENAYSKEMEEITFQDVSVGMSLGFAEILYRNDKPVGVSDKYEFTIKYEIEETEEETQTDTNTEKIASGEETPSGGGNNTSTANSSKEVPVLSEPIVNITEPSVENQILEFSDVYFAFGFDDCQYVVITPSKIWDNERRICDVGSADSLASKLGLEPLMESTYTYDHQYNESQLRHLLTAFQARENSELIK